MYDDIDNQDAKDIWENEEVPDSSVVPEDLEEDDRIEVATTNTTTNIHKLTITTSNNLLPNAGCPRQFALNSHTITKHLLIFQPIYDILYKQSVGAEDVFMNMGFKDPSSMRYCINVIFAIALSAILVFTCMFA